MRVPDFRRCGQQRQRAVPHAVDRQRGATVHVRSDRHHLVAPVAVEIGDARRAVLEDKIGVKLNRPARPGAQAHRKPAGFCPVAENTMVVARRGGDVPGGRNVARVRARRRAIWQRTHVQSRGGCRAQARQHH